MKDKQLAPTPESDSEMCEFAPTNDPRYDGPVEWVPAWKARELERQRDEYDKARQKIAAMIVRAAPNLEVKFHGFMQNESEKKLAFEREDAMRSKLEEAVAANNEMGAALEKIAAHYRLDGITANSLSDWLIENFKYDGWHSNSKTEP